MKRSHLGATAALLGGTLLAGAVPAHAAALPGEFQQMATAMAAVQSYKLTMDITSHMATQSTTSSVVLISVRHGKTQAVYEKMHLSIGGSAMSLEMVLEGKRTCIRGLMGPSWTCSTTKSSLVPGGANLSNLTNLYQMTASLTRSFHIVSVGRKTVQRQLCDGFSIAGTVSHMATTGTVWINAASHLLVEEDATTTQPLTPGGKPTTSTVKIVASNYNDPHLSIPAV